MHPYVNVERLAWQPERAAFAFASAETFRHTPDGRARLSDEVAAGITFEHGSRALQPDDPTRPAGP